MASERFWSALPAPSECLVSIVTPTLNRIDRLVAAIESVLAQDHPLIEHIVVGDDCPVLDGAADSLRARSSDIRIHNIPASDIRPEYPSARIAFVRNFGIARARGDVIAHLDDDNTFESDHVSSLVSVLAANPEVAVASSWRRLLVDGVEPWQHPLHVWASTRAAAEEVYDTYLGMGIYTAGSHLMRDRVTFDEERECTVDTNELMVRREVHERYPFPVDFTAEEIEEDIGEDDAFCRAIHADGLKSASSERFTLNFRIGGRFTAHLVEARSASSDPAQRG